MARAGTLPDYLYQKEVRVGEKVDLKEPHEGPEQEVRDLLDSTVNVVNDADVMKTNKVSTIPAAMKKTPLALTIHGNAEISRDVDFLVGATTRFGHSARFNRRFSGALTLF